MRAYVIHSFTEINSCFSFRKLFNREKVDQIYSILRNCLLDFSILINTFKKPKKFQSAMFIPINTYKMDVVYTTVFFNAHAYICVYRYTK